MFGSWASATTTTGLGGTAAVLAGAAGRSSSWAGLVEDAALTALAALAALTALTALAALPALTALTALAGGAADVSAAAVVAVVVSAVSASSVLTALVMATGALRSAATFLSSLSAEPVLSPGLVHFNLQAVQGLSARRARAI